MARENSFVFFGAIMNDPIVLFNDESKSYRITFSLETTRRNGRKDYPKINIYDLSEEQAKKYAATLKRGVFIQIHGMVYTRVVKKPVRCECCNNINQIDFKIYAKKLFQRRYKRFFAVTFIKQLREFFKFFYPEPYLLFR